VSCTSTKSHDLKSVNHIIFNYIILNISIDSDEISHTKTLTASLLLAGYPKAITASNSVVNRYDINFNAISFIFKTGFCFGEIGMLKKVSILDFFGVLSSLFRFLD